MTVDKNIIVKQIKNVLAEIKHKDERNNTRKLSLEIYSNERKIYNSVSSNTAVDNKRKILTDLIAYRDGMKDYSKISNRELIRIIENRITNAGKNLEEVSYEMGFDRDYIRNTISNGCRTALLDIYDYVNTASFARKKQAGVYKSVSIQNDKLNEIKKISKQIKMTIEKIRIKDGRTSIEELSQMMFGSKDRVKNVKSSKTALSLETRRETFAKLREYERNMTDYSVFTNDDLSNFIDAKIKEIGKTKELVSKEMDKGENYISTAQLRESRISLMNIYDYLNAKQNDFVQQRLSRILEMPKPKTEVKYQIQSKPKTSEEAKYLAERLEKSEEENKRLTVEITKVKLLNKTLAEEKEELLQKLEQQESKTFWQKIWGR